LSPAPARAGACRLGHVDYAELGQRPATSEVEQLVDHARKMGLWRFEEAPRYDAAALQAQEGLAA
jgi:hypothetical protein